MEKMFEKKASDTITENDAAQKIVLLIDDDEDEHEIFQSALKHTGNSINFIGANSCEEALKILRNTDPDYIFLDVNMPKINGMTCLEEIKKISRIAHIPIYMYSTGMNAHDGQKALQLGAKDYIIKPNSITSLSNLLKKILD